MSSQLDILALEPFYGGIRRSMLETIVRCSRHRWTVLKLPPRRMERRLTAAAVWFAEQLKAHWVGRLDILFTSEAVNLANLFQLMPQLARHPSVVYFHGNQLPPAGVRDTKPFEIVNLNTAASATEVWFNSQFHRRDFFDRATSLIGLHPDMAGQNPLPTMRAKAQVLSPPIDMGPVAEARRANPVPERDSNALFVDTRDADLKLFNEALARLRARGEKLRLITVGPLGALDLPADVPRRTLPENAESEHAKALLEAGVFVSVKRSAPCDFIAVRALVAGCRPVVPDEGVYPEILPASLREPCLYDPTTPDDLVTRIEDATSPFHPSVSAAELSSILRPYEPIRACRAIDERLEYLVKTHPPAPEEEAE
jgi:hypothetical protein